MYIRIFKEDMIDGVLKASSVISQKTGAAYLRTLWLKAEDDLLEIQCTDSNVEFIGKYRANVLEKGLVGVEGKKFNDLIRKLKPGEILFKSDDENNTLFVQQDKRKYKIPTTESSWFPELNPFPDENYTLWSGEVLKEIIDKVSFSISDDDTSGSMTCMKVSRGDEDKQEVEFCGFDTQNLSLYTVRDDNIYSLIQEDGLLIPKKYLLELRKWLSSGEIELSVSNQRFFVRKQDVQESISFPMSFDEYTDYKQIMDSFSMDLKSLLVINRNELMDALDRILIFSTEFNKSAVFVLKEDEVRIDSTAVETGEATEILSCNYQGDIDNIYFNIKGLLHILGHFSSEEISMNLSGQVDPCKVTGKNDPNYFVVTMPVEIQEETYYTEEEEELS